MDLEDSTSFKCKKLQPEGNPFQVNYHHGIGAVQLGHRCIIFGGYKHNPNRVPAEYVYIYDTTTNSWSCTKPSNFALSFGHVRMSFVAEDAMFSYAWHEIKRAYQFVWLDVVGMEEWNLVEDRNKPSVAIGTAGCFIERRNEALLFGGGDSTDVHVFRVEDKAWYTPEAKGRPPLPRAYHALCSNDNVVYVAGGNLNTTGPETPSLKMLDLHLLTIDKKTFTWSNPNVTANPTSGYLPKRRYLFTMTCVRNRVFIFGGYAGKSAFDVYSIKSNKWFTRNILEDDPEEPAITFAGNWSLGAKEHAAVQTPE